MSASVQTMKSLFGTTDFLIPLVLGDLTDDQAKTRSRGGDGPSIAWIVGHMLDFRYRMMNLLGAERQSPYAAAFGQTGATDGSGYPSVSELQDAWRSVAEELYAVMDGVTEGDLDGPVQGGPHGEEAVRDKASFLVWHEAYHLGALGAVRKSIGQPGPAEKVLAMMESASG